MLQSLNIAVRATAPVSDAIRQRHDAAMTRAFTEAATPYRRGWLGGLERRAAPAAAPWPGSDLAAQRLCDWQDAGVFTGTANPRLAGSALALLTSPRIEPVQGGLGALCDAFTAAACTPSEPMRQNWGFS